MSLRNPHEPVEQKTEPLKILREENVVKNLSAEEFVKLLVSSEETAKFALSTNYLLEKLNTLALDPLEQTFAESCVARCVLEILCDANKLSKDDCTRAKELEIYSRIWSSPGEVADIQKVLIYLSGYGFEIASIDIVKRSESILKTAAATVRTLYDSVISNAKLKKFSVDETSFPKSNVFLLIKLCNCPEQQHLHVEYAKFSDGKLLVFNSGKKEKHQNEYASFQEYFNQNVRFTGVAFSLMDTKKLLNKMGVFEEGKEGDTNPFSKGNEIDKVRRKSL